MTDAEKAADEKLQEFLEGAEEVYATGFYSVEDIIDEVQNRLE